MSELNVVTIIGRIANEPELKHSTNGVPYISLTLANHQSFLKEEEQTEETNFFKVRIWGKTAENLQQYLKKGKQIAVNGRLRQYSFDTPTGDKISMVEIVSNNLQLLSNNGKKEKNNVQSK